MVDQSFRMWTYRLWQPTYKNQAALNRPVTSVQKAVRSAQRFIRGLNFGFRRATVTVYTPMPTSILQMHREWQN